jgi:prefoldin subunit 5
MAAKDKEEAIKFVNSSLKRLREFIKTAKAKIEDLKLI